MKDFVGARLEAQEILRKRSEKRDIEQARRDTVTSATAEDNDGESIYRHNQLEKNSNHYHQQRQQDLPSSLPTVGGALCPPILPSLTLGSIYNSKITQQSTEGGTDGDNNSRGGGAGGGESSGAGRATRTVESSAVYPVHTVSASLTFSNPAAPEDAVQYPVEIHEDSEPSTHIQAADTVPMVAHPRSGDDDQHQQQQAMSLFALQRRENALPNRSAILDYRMARARPTGLVASVSASALVSSSNTFHPLVGEGSRNCGGGERVGGGGSEPSFIKDADARRYGRRGRLSVPLMPIAIGANAGKEHGQRGGLSGSIMEFERDELRRRLRAAPGSKSVKIAEHPLGLAEDFQESSTLAPIRYTVFPYRRWAARER